MIRFENVSKSFPIRGGHRVIVDRLNLTIPRGRSVGLIGRNGAGKTTLLRMISGSLDPDRGRIVRHARISWPLGFAGGFHGALTGAQNVRFAARIYGVDTDASAGLCRGVRRARPLPARTGRDLFQRDARAAGLRRLDWGCISTSISSTRVTAVGDEIFKRKCEAVFKRPAGGNPT
ncbi:MAG: ATP-binding protein [Paracoccaceae bacterium]|nr:MAG: ATP-binding protein [Paracoccaceae bacterium]